MTYVQLKFLLHLGNWQNINFSTLNLYAFHKYQFKVLTKKLKKVEKTTRPFRYELNQIHYDYTVKVRNRFKGLNLIDRLPDELWTEVRDCTGDRDQDHPHGKEMQKSKMAVWGGLTNSCEKKRSEKQRRKVKI